MNLKILKLKELEDNSYVVIIWKNEGNIFSESTYYKDGYFFQINGDGTPSKFTYAPTEWLVNNYENIAFIVDNDKEVDL